MDCRDPSSSNGLRYALNFDEGGQVVEVYFDGASTQWPGELVGKPNHPINTLFEEADDRGIIAGACGFCAESFG